MTSDLDTIIEALNKHESEWAYAITDKQAIHRAVFCCGEERRPKAILKFPDEEFEYSVCPICESY